MNKISTVNKNSYKAEILIVDDVEANLILLVNILTAQQYKVRAVLDGKMALSSANAKPPDLILLDVNMPILSGYQVCEQLKSNPLTNHIPVIFISALDDTKDKVKGFNVGGVDYITKPFKNNEVIARVKTHLTLSNLQQHLEHQNIHLQEEVNERKRVEELLQQTNQTLEIKVSQRTAKLLSLNTALEAEIAQHKQTGKILQQRTQRLELLREIDLAILDGSSPSQIAQIAVKHIRRLVPCYQTCVATFNFKADNVNILAIDSVDSVNNTHKQVAVFPRFPALITWPTQTEFSLSGYLPQFEQFQTVIKQLQQGKIVSIKYPLPSISESQSVKPTVLACTYVPFKLKNELAGYIALHTTHTNTLTQQNQEIIYEVANLLAVVIKQDRLQAQIEHNTEQLEQRVNSRTKELLTLQEITAIASASLNLQPTLEYALNHVLNTINNSMGTIHLFNKNRTQLDMVTHHGLSPNTINQLKTITAGNGLIGQVITQKETVITSNSMDSFLANTVQLDDQFEVYIGLPMRARGEIVGVFSVFQSATQLELNVEEISFLASVADEIGVVVENNRLHELSKQTAVIKERSRLARELHDSVTQLLYSINLFAQSGRNAYHLNDWDEINNCLIELEDIARQALKEMRLLIYELRPPELEQGTLAEALKLRLDSVENRAGISTQLHLNHSKPLPKVIEEALYRIAYEALNNILKYAKATAITIKLDNNNQNTTLSIIDNGVGFDRNAVKNKGGVGLLSMQERVEKLGGQLSIRSTPNAGTNITVNIPNTKFNA